MIFDPQTSSMIIKGIGETLYMVLLSSAIAYIIGLPLGIILVVTRKDGIHPMAGVEKVLGFIINIFRSIPFIILLIMVRPVTELIVRTTLGPNAVVVPLVIAAAPYIARVVEGSLLEVDYGVIEAAKSMGASTWQIICKVLVPEAKPALYIGGALSVTTILAYSAMAGFVGGIAIRYGYYRYQTDVMLLTVAILVIIVQIIQEVGNKVSKKTDKRIR